MSVWQYWPHGTSEKAILSQNVVRKLKQEGFWRDANSIDHDVVKVMSEGCLRVRAEHTCLNEILSSPTLFVPIPSSSPIGPKHDVENIVWPSRAIARLLCAGVSNSSMSYLLTREQPVQKSAWAKPRERPSPEEHYEPAPPALPDGTGVAYVFPADRARQTTDIAATIDLIKAAREDDIQVERVSIGGRIFAGSR